jgi:hypothetical protein
VLRQLSGAELQRRAAAVDKRSMSASRRRELGISTPRPGDGRRGTAAAGFALCPKSSSGNDRPVTSSVSAAPQERGRHPPSKLQPDLNIAKAWSPSNESDWCELDFGAPETVGRTSTLSSSARGPWSSQPQVPPPCTARRCFHISSPSEDLPQLVEEDAAESLSTCMSLEDLPLLEPLPTHVYGWGTHSGASSPVTPLSPLTPLPESPASSSSGVASLLLPPPSPFADHESVVAEPPGLDPPAGDVEDISDPPADAHLLLATMRKFLFESPGAIADRLAVVSARVTPREASLMAHAAAAVERDLATNALLQVRFGACLDSSGQVASTGLLQLMSAVLERPT